MELRRCNHLHFIQAIRAGSVRKVLNVDYRGRPALVFKNLEDVYKSEDAKKLDGLSTLQSQDSYASTVSDCDRFGTEIPCLPFADRKMKKKDLNKDEFNHNSDDGGEDSTDDLNFGKMTLKQLKEQCKTKKRKVVDSACLSLKQDYSDWQPEDDECDLEERISSWKSKVSKKLKGKRTHAKKYAPSFSHTEVSANFEQIPSAEGSLQSSGCLPAPIDVKVEVYESEYSECRNMTCVADDNSNSCSEPLGLCGGVSGEILLAAKTECVYGEQISLTEEDCQICVVSEVCYDHLEDVERNCLLPSTGGEAMEVDNLKMTCHQFLVSPSSDDNAEGYVENPLLEESSTDAIFSIKDQRSDLSKNFESNSSMHDVSTSISRVQVPDMAMDNSICCIELCSAGGPCMFEDNSNENLPPSLEIDSLNSPLNSCSSSGKSDICLSPEIALVSAEDDPLATEKASLMSISADTTRNCLSPHKSPIAFEGGSTTTEEKQALRSTPDDVDINSSKRNHNCDALSELSLPEIKDYHHQEQYPPPERLLSTRKAISPMSREKLCQAMKEVELNEVTDLYKCKGKLQFGKGNENEISPAELNTKGADVNMNPEALGEVYRTMDAISPKQITKKLRNDRKGSPPKCFRRVSRSLPQVSAGATSIQSCSERAIAFSQRQMQDIESLATKLMQELKFMKDIVEEKLHPEESPTTLLKYNVDEVKTAVKSATKVEETTKKWLSMMARDCNRFCKLMKVTQKDEIASGNAIPKERKKITFADEAGGVLCHVKFIEDDMTSLDSKS
ncbi:Titin like [Actinidia chinensis var. chinensis]|uniref:Titin like n=1 Tax=Actinidia chinensis var. chinensis TaxID=1590841 RepID=A0A2R6PZY8_ACTCC|nr:Titin like [Actinidia chinensis var. chinensis]